MTTPLQDPGPEQVGEHAGLSMSGEEAIAAALWVGCEVMVQKEMSPERFLANIAGWVSGRAVILDGPRSLVGTQYLFLGNILYTRYLQLGTLYGFVGQAESVLRGPLLVVLDWPHTVEVVDLKGERRALSNSKAELELFFPQTERGWPPNWPICPLRGVLAQAGRGP